MYAIGVHTSLYSAAKSVGDFAMDAALAIPRGVEGFAESVYGLADWITMDVLPDWDRQQDNLFGRD